MLGPQGLAVASKEVLAAAGYDAQLLVPALEALLESDELTFYEHLWYSPTHVHWLCKYPLPVALVEPHEGDVVKELREYLEAQLEPPRHGLWSHRSTVFNILMCIRRCFANAIKPPSS
jgi:hypothetical protein